MAIKIAFFDVDNTLYDWKHHNFPASGIEAVKQLKKNGVLVYICSARPYDSQKSFGLFDLGIDWDGYITSSGAAAFVRGKCIESIFMDHSDVRKFDRLCKKHNLSFEVVTLRKRFMVRPVDQYCEAYHKNFADTYPEVHPYYNENATGVMWFAPEEYDEEFKKAFPNLLFFRFHPAAVDVTPAEHRKGYMIASVLNHLGLKSSEAIAFGDDLQDISMGDSVDTLVCMGNGRDEVKAAADYVTDPTWEDGIANALKHFELI